MLRHTQDFSPIRKHAADFLGRSRARPGGPTPIPSAPSSAPLVANMKKPPRSGIVSPIIMLSPSASSLIRMSNVKDFLEGGFYQPADSSAGGGMLQVSRTIPSIDPARPTRFILVDGPEQFKPDYWARVVAVFTTGQTWQFKSYKWTNAADLFSHALGVYVGWNGEEVPPTVRGYGRAVKTAQIDKWSAAQGERGRWRDREVVEGIWSAVEGSMRAKGWTREGPATAATR